ncbi:MAG: T9SS type A sorting domain-containing protein [Candidatus Kapabacteria bacterium]|nr:T9SS type A sorting domain-containing protein [Candidatus Kapabacteria bacterium]
MKTKLFTNVLVFFLFTFFCFSQEKWIQSKILANYKGLPAILEIKYLGNGKCLATAGYSETSLNLLKSSDNGLTWEVYHQDWDYDLKKTVPNPFEATASSIINENAIFVAFTDDAAVKRYYSDPKKQDTFKISFKEEIIRNIKMKDEKFGVLTNKSEVFITKDGWKSYDTTSLGILVYDVNIQNNGYITFLSQYNDSSVFALSKNQGKNWEFYYIDNNCFPSKQSFVNDSVGWVLSDRMSGIGDTESHLIHKTTDGGHTWKKQLDTFSFNFFTATDIKFKDENFGIAFGQNKMIYETSDGGHHWIASQINTPRSHEFKLKFEYTEDMILVGTVADGIWRRPIIKTGVEEFEQVYSTYPNPFNNSFVIEDSKIPDGTYNLKLIDIGGSEILNNQIEYNGSIKIQIDLQKGCYFWNLVGTKSFYGKTIKDN